ncbi:MAG TPA: hypothetical protein VF512_18375, partial [Actinomycetota bacterium]
MIIHGSHRPRRPAAGARATLAAPARLAAATAGRALAGPAARVGATRPAGLGGTAGTARLGSAPGPG